VTDGRRAMEVIATIVGRVVEHRGDSEVCGELGD
jgi:hypothetical protein